MSRCIESIKDFSDNFGHKQYSPSGFFNTETYLTGLSDCHKLVIFVFKTTFSKTGPEEMMYKDFKKFDEEIFNQELRTSFSSETAVHDYASFEGDF